MGWWGAGSGDVVTGGSSARAYGVTMGFTCERRFSILLGLYRTGRVVISSFELLLLRQVPKMYWNPYLIFESDFR